MLWSLWHPSRQASHIPCSLTISGGASTRGVVASTGRITAKTLSAAPTVLGVSTGCLSRPSKKLADILRLQPQLDRRFLARYLTRWWAVYISSTVQRESVFYRQFCTLLSPIAQSDSKIPCRYHFHVDYELCACDVLFSSFKTEIVFAFIYSIIFNIADELLNLGKFNFNIWRSVFVLVRPRKFPRNLSDFSEK